MLHSDHYPFYEMALYYGPTGSTEMKKNECVVVGCQD